MTTSTIVTLLTFAAGWLAKHYDLVGKLGSLVGLAAGPNPLAPPAGTPSAPSPAPVASAHPVLSDAVSAAIHQAVGDATAGKIASLKDELIAVAKAAAEAAVADLQKKA